MFGTCGGFITYNRVLEDNQLRTGVTPIALSQAGCALVTVFVFFFDLVTACKDVDLDTKRDIEVIDVEFLFTFKVIQLDNA